MLPTLRRCAAASKIIKHCGWKEGPIDAATNALVNIRLNEHLNAFTNLQKEEVILSEAKKAQERAFKRELKHALDGRLIAIKDNIATIDLPTTCASYMLKDYQSPFDATVVERLRDKGAIVVGKTNMDEFGMGSHSTFSPFGPVSKPGTTPLESLAYSAGGSSGGSAAAVAAGMCDIALGTDTGGSVRLPASYCGLVGFKPSYGMLSRWGVVAYANSLDTVGIIANHSNDVKAVWKVLNFPDKLDPTCVETGTRMRVGRMIEDFHRVRRDTRKDGRFRIGVPMEYNVEEMAEGTRKLWDATLEYLAQWGCEIVPISLPHTRHALPAYYILAPAEASSNLARYDGIRYGTRHEQDRDGETLFAPTRAAGFGDEVRRRILLGTYSLSSEAMGNYFVQAQKVRRLVQKDFDSVFAMPNGLDCDGETKWEDRPWNSKGVDVIVCPTALGESPKLEDVNKMSQTERYAGDVLTVPASLAGLPAVSMPVSKKVGMQVIGQWGDEKGMWEVAVMLEKMRKGEVGAQLADEAEAALNGVERVD
ncbi:A subunit of putative glutamyl-tRNA amidotransferase [Pyronema domesticum]|uniref:Glutamyl-tRNA(Gln) amidotransferase subunit A, mitochondrial n=1 Tax=Pyronema omphalodes (strain CBS 100304) TaxID=1076935 RepID=U4L0Y9_PYROM|nr:A subunit of putative glutamyl-tRNA amidotransferase [Pyronema domesticum]CCX05729.1 Similar to Glutamyl-tRNA(Gln) amidotransferase subunit A, mitochondrial; acc. no. C5P3I5 [Pyronema omphalodes CBS 100304]